MYGTWFGVILSFVGGLLLLIALLAAGWLNPIFAILIAIVAVAVAIPLMSRRRSGSERSDQIRGGAGGEPASGEGASGVGEGADMEQGRQRAGRPRSDRTTEGIWGERGEA